MREKTLKKKIYKYTAVFELNELGGYTVTVPALPGLVSEGRNLKEAKKMAKDAIEGYLESLISHSKEVPEESPRASRPLVVKEKIAVAV